MNVYLLEQLVNDRLAEARARAAQRALNYPLEPARRPVRVALGLALIRAGQWIAGPAPRRAGRTRRATA
ncbi:MAG TPA: hypothetical protein VMS64_29990 [Candidatus Methylomirabilis sp.]|nr:hypothetical protein [Candidatus Methylomirabilis sp.]